MISKLDLALVYPDEIQKIMTSGITWQEKLAIVADCCRLNALSAIKNAGSGHVGSSFSSMDLMVYLYFHCMNTIQVGFKDPNRDVFFSSKGHDCPAQYAVLAAAGAISMDQLLSLRRLDGLPGHPDVSIPGIEANSGSLGMGISKARGIAMAKTLGRHDGHVYVLCGDGELQEGQIWEACHAMKERRVCNHLTVIIDSNGFQTDERVYDEGDVFAKFDAAGFHFEQCMGHDFISIDEALTWARARWFEPTVIIASTIKGKGVQFMESTYIKAGEQYKWHSGAPSDDDYKTAMTELLARIHERCNKAGIIPVKILTRELFARPSPAGERIVAAYGDALVELGKKHESLVVLDADLATDCGLRPFQKTFPRRFIENGIAEQDMVSVAGGLALQGFIPVVNSFAAFLASRANEQIFNNATENTKIIYACHLAGITPASPGVSHQGTRDISLLAALPNITIIEPCNAEETKKALAWCIEKTSGSSALRLHAGPSPGQIILPPGHAFDEGKGTVLVPGDDAIIFAYGPVLLNEALKAVELLPEDIKLCVIDMPWLNRIDIPWLETVVSRQAIVFVMDDHSTRGGLGDAMLNAFNLSNVLRGTEIHKLGVVEYPACGTAQEVLEYHDLDARSIVKQIMEVYI